MGTIILSRLWARKGKNDAEDKTGSYWKNLEKMEVLKKRAV